MRASSLARLYRAAKADAANPRTRYSRPEPVELRRGTTVLCESKGEEDFWTGLTGALESKALRPEDFSIRELFEALVPHGREIVDSWNPKHGGGGESLVLLEASGAVNTAAFKNISGQVVYSAFMEGFEDEGYVFTPVFPTVSTQFSGEKIAGITKLGGGEDYVIPEGATYPRIGPAEDYIDTPQTAKHGVMSGLTREAIFFDRTGQLVQRAAEVGKEMGYWKEVAAIDAFIDENVTTHRYKWKGTTYATYQTSTPWDNTTASAGLVDWTDVDEAEQTLSAIVDPNTGRPIINVPKDIVVTRQNLNVARRVLSATELRFGDGASASTQTIFSNPIQNYRILSSQLLAARMGTDTTWYLGDLARQVKCMENFPLTVVQSPANSEAEWNRDIVMEWKASHRYVFAVVEPRVTTTCTA
jgi:hypothetical protein